MKGIQKTVYFTEDLISNIGECKSFSHRVIDLIQKGLMYEKIKEGKTTLEQALGYFNWQYKEKYPENDLPILK